MNKKFKRSFDSLQAIFDFTEHFFASEALDRSLRFAVELSLEELFTNLVKYNAGNPNEILLSMEKSGDSVVVSLTDFDVEGFDVTRATPVETEAPAEERPIGGLGLHLVRNMVDTLDYQYRDRCSRITFTKKLG